MYRPIRLRKPVPFGHSLSADKPGAIEDSSGAKALSAEDVKSERKA